MASSPWTKMSERVFLVRLTFCICAGGCSVWGCWSLDRARAPRRTALRPEAALAEGRTPVACREAEPGASRPPLSMDAWQSRRRPRPRGVATPGAAPWPPVGLGGRLGFLTLAATPHGFAKMGLMGCHGFVGPHEPFRTPNLLFFISDFLRLQSDEHCVHLNYCFSTVQVACFVHGLPGSRCTCTLGHRAASSTTFRSRSCRSRRRPAGALGLALANRSAAAVVRDLQRADCTLRTYSAMQGKGEGGGRSVELADAEQPGVHRARRRRHRPQPSLVGGACSCSFEG
jgi:hypothetical protein